jgi:hypothetical protein
MISTCPTSRRVLGLGAGGEAAAVTREHRKVGWTSLALVKAVSRAGRAVWVNGKAGSVDEKVMVGQVSGGQIGQKSR